MTQSPWLWLIAGPNGSGKSTYAPNLSSEVEEIVRPDELADIEFCQGGWLKP